MVNPIPCRAGTYSNVAGMSNDSCEVTPEGHYSQAGSPFPIPCVTGTFQSQKGQPSCTISLPGHYVPEQASLSQLECSEGSYQPNFGSTNCIISSQGHYVDAAGLATQTPCPSGTFSNRIGAISVDDCKISPPGSYWEGFASPCFARQGISTRSGIFIMSRSLSRTFCSFRRIHDQFACDAGTYQPMPAQPVPCR